MMTSPNEVSLKDLIAAPFYPVHRDIKTGGHTHYWLKGGRGSTKSSFVGVEIPQNMMRDAQRGLITHAVVLRRYGVTIRESVYEQLIWAIHALGVGHLWQANISPMKLTYLPTGQSIIFRGVDDATKLKSLKVGRGYVKYIWFEEVNEFEGPEKLRNVLQSLMRGGPEFVAFYTYNPPKSARNWVNQYVLAARADTLVHHSDYRAVPPEWLGEQFLTEAGQLEKLNSRAYRHEYLGEVTGAGGEVFENISVRRITAEEREAFDRIYKGVDWGYYPDPWAFNEMHYDAARRTLYIFGELTRYKSSNQKTAEALREYGVEDDELITADSAETKSVQDYKDYGLFCKGALKGPGSVDYSMKWLQGLTQIVIDPVTCPDTVKEFTGYEYERAKDGEIISGYPDRDNHHIDAVRYAMETVWKRRGQ